MVTDAREPSRGYHVPSTDNTISEDMARLILALTAVGVDVAGLLEDVAGKAAAVHGHQIADITGLATALANKASADHVHALGGLSDVDTAGASVYQVLTKSIDGKWRPWTIDLANAIGGAAYARLDGATFTGETKVPTPSTAADSLNAVNVTSLRTFVAGANYARLDGATFTGPTKVPTPSTAADSLNAVNVTSLRAFVSSAISALVASSPSTLDTLNELATALGNDPNFAATISTALGNKAAKSTIITAGAGLTGGGDLSANRSLAVDFATPAETVAGEIDHKPAAPSGVHAAIVAALGSISAIEPGMIGYTAEQNPPTGWLERNGAAISRTAYAALFAKIGTTFGAGNGATTFNLPDARGTFDRGWDHGRGYDPGRTFGSYQADMFGSHSHTFYCTGSDGFTSLNPAMGDGRYPKASPTTVVGGSETRPKNVAYLPIIKY